MDVRPLIAQVLAGQITAFEAQRLVAQDFWQGRRADGAPGTAAGDWGNAARLLNETLFQHNIDGVHW